MQFEGRKKAFVIKDLDEFKDIVGKIYTNGYKEDLILQDFIPGDDSNMRVLNAYVDKNHQVKMMCLATPSWKTRTDCHRQLHGNRAGL